MKAKKHKRMTPAQAGRLGGLKGGWLRWFRSLSPEERREHQRRAALASWKTDPEVQAKRNAGILEAAARGGPEKETYATIAKRFSVSLGFASRLARLHGIKRVADTRFQKARNAAIAEAANGPESYATIAKRFNVSEGLVSQMARTAGVRRRR